MLLLAGQEHATLAVTVLIAALIACVLFNIARARRRGVFIRPIPGLRAIDEAAGRATEMGRPILFTTGSEGEKQLQNVITYAALAVLQHVARIAARLGSRLLVTVCDPSAFPITREVVKRAYQAESRTAEFRPADVRFLAGGQFAWAFATMGLMLEERAASCFYFGAAGAESLMLGETGHQAGAIQVAGTQDLYQIPFYIASCDYAIIAEEYFAASACLSDDPVMRGSLVGQDWVKMLWLALIIVGVLFATFTVPPIGTPGGLGWRDHNWFLERVLLR